MLPKVILAALLCAFTLPACSSGDDGGAPNPLNALPPEWRYTDPNTPPPNDQPPPPNEQNPIDDALVRCTNACVSSLACSPHYCQQLCFQLGFEFRSCALDPAEYVRCTMFLSCSGDSSSRPRSLGVNCERVRAELDHCFSDRD